MNPKITNYNDTPEHIILQKLKNFKSEEQDPWFQKSVDLFLILCSFMKADLFEILSFQWKHWKNSKIKYDVIKVIQSKKHYSYIRATVDEEIAQLIMKYANQDKSEDAYIFPLLTPNLNDDDSLAEADIFEKTMNEYLEKVSEIIGIEKISISDTKRLWQFFGKI